MTRRVIVRGHPGLAAAGIIVWPEAGLTIAVIGMGPPAPGSGQAGRATLPFSRLAALAGALEEPA
jgi:hypothetical protein